MKFMNKKGLYFAISLLLLIPGLISLVMFGLRFSIDFTGGSLIEIQTSEVVSTEKIKSITQSQDIEVSSVASAGEKVILIRTKPITQEKNNQLKTELQKQIGPITERRFETVGPTIGAELSRKAILAVVVASVAIIVYLAWSFRGIPKPYASWKFGVSAVIALIHDVLVVLGVFSLLGHFYHVEIDALFVTAVLTVIGFSVHDTIVVFDRIRENVTKMPKSSFYDVVDFSLTETIARSLITSVTVILTLLSLLLFGGESIRWFVVALLIGILSGTYSSIFNAAPILAIWEERSTTKK